MLKRAIVISTVFAGALGGAAYAQDKADKGADQKFCDQLMKFHADVSALDALGPSSTIGELRTTVNKVADDADAVKAQSGKMKSPTAKQFTDAANQLRKEVRSMPDSVTIDQAKSRIRGDIQNVKQAGHKLAMESGCQMPEKESTQPGGEGMTPQQGTQGQQGQGMPSHGNPPQQGNQPPSE